VSAIGAIVLGAYIN